MSTQSLWQVNNRAHSFKSIDDDMSTDVVVVGGGNTGITAAYLMKKAGFKVIVLEKSKCGEGNTSHTSAHLTYITDMRISELIRKYGKDHATAVWDAGNAAIQQIQEIVTSEKIPCDFTRVPGFITSSLVDTEDESDALQKEASQAKELGFDVEYINKTPLFNRPGIRVANQARFHPLKYLHDLVKKIPGDGCHIFENTHVDDISGDEIIVLANGKKIKARYVFIATDVPIQGKTGLVSANLFQTKIKPYTSYVIGANIPKGSAPDALIWDTYDPYHYYRMLPGDTSDYVVFGGADHKTGQQDIPEANFEKLEQLLRKYIPHLQCNYRWSGQVIESVDGLPYIGEITSNQFIATGYSGNGLTLGTLSAMMACDWMKGKTNPWADLFAPGRKKISALWNYLTENMDYPYYMAKDRIKNHEKQSTATLSLGQGRVLNIDGQRVACYRDKKGELSTFSPVCPHMGCIVHWNEVETTWDCPCHGSRFQSTGELLAGPAEKGLEAF